MGIFNNEPQPGNVNDPNYFRYSEPVKDLKANTSAGLALTGAAADIEGASSLSGQIAKDFIKNGVRSLAEPVREDFTNELKAARDSIVPAPVQTGAGSAAGGPVLGADGQDHTAQPIPDNVKAGVANGLSRFQTIQDGYVNGHINDTWYHGQQATIATQLRSRYSGFTDYVDEQISKITGGNPANQQVADLMQDINRAATTKKTEQDKILDLARGAMGKGFDKANLQYQRLASDPSYAPTFMQWYTEENAKDTALSRDTAALQNQNLHGADAAKGWKQNLNQFVSNKIDGDLNATLTLTGMNKPETIMAILQRAQADPNAYTGQQMEELATKLQIHQNTMRAQLSPQINANKNYQQLSPAERDAELDSQLKNVYGSMYDAVKGGGAAGAGAAFAIANQFRAVMDQTKYNLTQGDLGKAATNFEILSQKLGPGLAANLVGSFLNGQKNLPANLAPLFMEKASEAHAQPGGPANPTTIADHMRSIDADKRISPTDKAYVYKELNATVKTLTDPNAPNEDKASIIQYLYNPKNNGNLSYFRDDYTTPTPDRKGIIVHPGKTTIWTQLTDPDVTKNVKKLDEPSQGMYRSWVDITGRELIGGDVKTLNHFTGHDNLYFDWKNTGDGKPMLVLRDKEGALGMPTVRTNPVTGEALPIAPNAPVSAGYRQQVQQVVDRINKALPNLEHVYKTFGGGNTEQMLLQTLQQYGMDFNGHISGLPKAFGDAVANSRKPEKKPGE